LVLFVLSDLSPAPPSVILLCNFKSEIPNPALPLHPIGVTERSRGWPGTPGNPAPNPIGREGHPLGDARRASASEGRSRPPGFALFGVGVAGEGLPFQSARA